MKQITKEQALAAIKNREFGAEILLSAQKVAVILTQSWCPQWHAMKQFVSGYNQADLYVLEYDLVDYFDAFREFKERVFGNDQIPYIRYYRAGVLTGESNAVSEELFTLYLDR